MDLAKERIRWCDEVRNFLEENFYKCTSNIIAKGSNKIDRKSNLLLSQLWFTIQGSEQILDSDLLFKALQTPGISEYFEFSKGGQPQMLSPTAEDVIKFLDLSNHNNSKKNNNTTMQNDNEVTFINPSHLPTLELAPKISSIKSDFYSCLPEKFRNENNKIKLKGIKALYEINQYAQSNMANNRRKEGFVIDESLIKSAKFFDCNNPFYTIQQFINDNMAMCSTMMMRHYGLGHNLFIAKTLLTEKVKAQIEADRDIFINTKSDQDSLVEVTNVN
jgi:hypothetical protein